MANSQFYREQSRKNWSTAPDGRQVTIEEIQIGCLQRIADSLEGVSLQLSRISGNSTSIHKEKSKNALLRKKIKVLQNNLKAHT